MCEDLYATQTPHNFKRSPRSLLELKYWKAHELKHFLLYYGPFILRTINEDIRTHILKLSVAIRLLLDPITEACVNAAEKLLQEFISETPRLYGNLSQTHNHHLLRHIPDQVNFNP